MLADILTRNVPCLSSQQTMQACHIQWLPRQWIHEYSYSLSTRQRQTYEDHPARNSSGRTCFPGLKLRHGPLSQDIQQRRASRNFAKGPSTITPTIKHTPPYRLLSQQSSPRQSHPRDRTMRYLILGPAPQSRTALRKRQYQLPQSNLGPRPRNSSFIMKMAIVLTRQCRRQLSKTSTACTTVSILARNCATSFS